MYDENVIVCDQCSVARATWIVALKSGRTLIYCTHHKNANQEALIASGAMIYEVAS